MIAPTALEPDRRDAARLLAEILARRPGYTPEWLAPPQSAGTGLAAVTARFLEAIVQRLNQAPDKNKLAFLDLLGLGLIPAQAARAPIVFQLAPEAGGGSAPARTLVAAPPPPGGNKQILFETEQAVGVTAGRLVQIFSLWPGRDEYIDHSEAFARNETVQPFAALLRRNTPHHLYLAHPVLLALAGNVQLAVEFELTHPSTSALEILWEYWDGKVWRGFKSTSPECQAASARDFDSTDGLTQSGHYVLEADCAQAAPAKVNGVEGHWLRGRLTQPLVSDPGQALPEVDSIRLSSIVERSLRGRIKVAEPREAPAVAGAGFLAANAGVSARSSLTGRVTNEAGHPVKDAVVQLIDPANPGQPPLASNGSNNEGNYEIPNVNFGREYLYEVLFAGLRFTGPEATRKPAVPASTLRPVVDLSIAVEGLEPDKAFADGATLDTSKPFYPLGQQPQPGTAFYLSNEEAFSKPGAGVRVYLARTRSPQDEGNITGLAPASTLAHQLDWEYWNGRQWAPLAVVSNFAGSLLDLDRTEVVDFTVPEDMVARKVNDTEARWVRARLQSGTYGFRQEVAFNSTSAGSATNRFTYLVTQPPVLAAIRLGYTWQYGPFYPERVTTYNDFRYQDHTEEAIWPGVTFLPFERVADLTPALYLGFDKRPPADQLGIFFDVAEEWGEPVGPALVWEYWDGFAWRRFPADDQTGALRRPGIVNLLAQPDDSPLDRFGTPLHWVRARLKEDGPPGEPAFNGIFPNAVWASERHSSKDLPVGTSLGTPNQAFAITQTPVLAGEVLELRELNGARANVEWRILATQLFGADAAAALPALERALQAEGPEVDVVRGALRLRRNRRKEVTEAWVRWESRDQLYFSAAADRHYTLDRALGRLVFGDGVNGRVPDAGAAILIREMSSGGGAAGNVAARAITQLLGVVPGIQAVFNPRAAEGGADGESLPAALVRGPRTVRHRGRAIDANAYETLAREASPAVAIARAIPGRNPAGVRQPGWITLLIVPWSLDRRPYPSFGLREQVRRFLESRAHGELASLGRIQVTGPEYLPVDVAATIVAIDASQAGVTEKRAREALELFLHPLLGGPAGEGWDLGRDVFLSDLAAVLERTEGVDFVEELALLFEGVPQGESLAVDEHRVVTAGTITLRLREAEK